ncbi:MAG: endonuclease III [Spirochaeta sp.]|nr:endonuclease III [Spirochaeta sp.]
MTTTSISEHPTEAPLPWKTIFELIGRPSGAELPSVSLIARGPMAPFHILIATIISLRTKDEVTLTASRRLLEVAATPEALLQLPESRISELIYPAGFYRTKARNMLRCAEILVREYGGRTPDTATELLSLPGVGPKTANLVLGLGFGLPAICVDTHVHRIPNRAGWIATRNPEETETALKQILPQEHWIEINEILVYFGQHICTPQSPRCSVCPITNWCKRIGVKKTR